MRCPKCHYVSFDGQSRCRNCGYDFSLVQPAADPVDLPTRTEPASATPLADLSLKMDEPSGETPSVLDRYIASPSAPAGAGPGQRGAGAGAGARGGADAGVSAGFGATAGAGAGAAAARAALRGARAGATEAESDPLDLPLFSPAAPGGGAGAASAASPASRGSASRTAPDDRPLVSGATPPRPPLSVRRTTGEIARARPRVTPQSTPQRVEEPRLELEIPEPSMLPDFEEDADERVDMLSSRRDMTGDATSAATAAGNAGAASRAPVIASRGRAESSADTRGDSRQQARSSADAYADADTTAAAAIDTGLAPLGTRVIAGLLDVVFMAIVDAFVLYFTLRVTSVSFGDLRRLPVAPLAGFLALLNGGYLTMFTAASGQTMGKMLMGVKVVTARGGPVPFGSAVVRAIVWLLTIVPAGVGFIPALLTSDRRALHDRFADTKVIKTSD